MSLRLFGLSVAVTLAALACGSSADVAVPGTGGGGGAGVAQSSSSTGGSTGTSMSSCMPACDTGQFCSVTLKCIPNGTCANDGDCKTGGTVCDLATGACVPGGCASQQLEVTPVPPNLLIALDRSCSMNQPPDGVMGGATKWEIASTAINGLTTKLKGKIRFGITMFPERFTAKANDCLQVAPIPVPVGPNNEAAVQALLVDPSYAPANPCVTNIDTGFEQAASDPGLQDAKRGDYVVLMTDGAQSASCGGKAANAGTVDAITKLAAGGVHTFVIGFGGAVDATALTSFAQAGLEKNPNAPPDYYDASDQASLDAAFKLIASKTLGCVFELKKAPEDPNQVYAFFDGMSVPRDPTHADGWDYDAATNEVTFYGMACGKLEEGKINKLDVVYGCNAPPPK